MKILLKKLTEAMEPAKYFRILSISLCTGLILSIVHYVLPIIFFAIFHDINPFTHQVFQFTIGLITFLLFLFSGLLYLKDMTYGQILLSGMCFSLYTAGLLMIQWFFQTILHFSPAILPYFMVPCALAMEPYYWLSQYLGLPMLRPLVWLFSTLIILCYTIFGHRSKESL